jgi:2-desacetyl-2-hydroxyethyl bacteriochlorophyllide A dehydrogenase
MKTIDGHAVWFSAPRTAVLRATTVRDPGPDQVMVRAKVSLISAGTEMLVYRGETSGRDPLPPNAEGTLGFPIKYGYQCVGVVERAGAATGLTEGDRVFTRHPHQDLFTTNVIDTWVIPLPDSVPDESAAFLNLTRVALTALIDVPVRLGEVVVVSGQGIVGLMCARLARRTAGRVIVIDPIPKRREIARSYGVDAAVAPEEARAAVSEMTDGRGADVTFEASGSPRAFATAIELTATRGTVVSLSYYGNRPVSFVQPKREQRIVSSLAGVQPRWDPMRRTEATLELLAKLSVTSMISARVPFAEAPAAYKLVDERPDSVLGVLLQY